MVVKAFNANTQESEVDLYEFKAILSYIASTSPTGAS